MLFPSPPAGKETWSVSKTCSQELGKTIGSSMMSPVSVVYTLAQGMARSLETFLKVVDFCFFIYLQKIYVTMDDPVHACAWQNFDHDKS